MARRPHAAARARIVATLLSFAAFGVIGRAIDVAASVPHAAASSATTTSTLTSSTTGSATSATPTTRSSTTTQAVTTTHAS